MCIHLGLTPVNPKSLSSGATVVGLTAAFQAVAVMSRFSASLSATDNLNLAAYIASRRP
jgi:hydroxyethylthiazole kinase-like sugar kinase family protein